jgi:hypothetical protein
MKQSACREVPVVFFVYRQVADGAGGELAASSERIGISPYALETVKVQRSHFTAGVA